MNMDGTTIETEIAGAGVQLAVPASKNVAGVVANRFQAIRTKKASKRPATPTRRLSMN